MDSLAAVLARVPDPAAPVLAHPLDSVTLDTVEPERVLWLWQGRIPFGKVTIIEGDPGVGKGHLVGAIVAAVTTGAALPGAGSGEPHAAARAACNVVIVSLEDGTADVLRPRMEAAGADLRRVRVVTALPSIPRDVAALSALVSQDQARLLVLDPITAYLGGETDSYKDQDTRRALMPLAQLAEASGCAVILVRHLPKTRHRSAVLAGAGSIGFIGLARTALFVAPKPDDPERRVVAVAKSNLAEMPASLEFRITATPAGSRLDWLGRSELTAGALHAAHADAANEDVSQTDEAATWLREQLNGREMPRAEVLKAGRGEGFSDRVVRRAASKAGVSMIRRGFPSSSVWGLSPEPGPTPPLQSDRPEPSQTVKIRRSDWTNDGPTGVTVAPAPQVAIVRTPPPLPDDVHPDALRWLTL